MLMGEEVDQGVEGARLGAALTGPLYAYGLLNGVIIAGYCAGVACIIVYGEALYGREG